MILIYFLVAFLSTLAGSLTGMGGGVIMKPVMDILGDFDPATIGVLSSVTVFAMSLVSCGRQLIRREKFAWGQFILLGLGAVGGGYIGQILFQAVQGGSPDNIIKIIQNSVLAVLIIIIFIYMLKKDSFPSLHLKHPIAFILTGIFLGIISSFLGIGGGPINVTILLFLFSIDMKTAIMGSLISILFAQISKLGTILVTSGFGIYHLEILPYMIIAAIAGATIGGIFNKKFSIRASIILFNSVQVVIFGFCIYNIVSGICVI